VLLWLLSVWQAKLFRDENSVSMQAMYLWTAGMLLLGRVRPFRKPRRTLLRRLHSLLYRGVGVQLLSDSLLLSLHELWLRVLCLGEAWRARRSWHSWFQMSNVLFVQVLSEWTSSRAQRVHMLLVHSVQLHMQFDVLQLLPGQVP
jgi:hypothetical protein